MTIGNGAIGKLIGKAEIAIKRNPIVMDVDLCGNRFDDGTNVIGGVDFNADCTTSPNNSKTEGRGHDGYGVKFGKSLGGG
jgi:hypothetical protein